MLRGGFTLVTTTLFKLLWIEFLSVRFVKYNGDLSWSSFVMVNYESLEEKICICDPLYENLTYDAKIFFGVMDIVL